MYKCWVHQDDRQQWKRSNAESLRDEDGIGQVKEGKGQSLVEASWTRVNIG
jgi:hypothetical protein